MKPTLNLATRTYVNRRALYLFYGGILAVLTLVLFFNASLYLRSLSETERLTERLAELETRIGDERGRSAESLTPQARDELRGRIAYANGILRRDAFRWTVLLDRLEEVLPEKVLISSIQPDYKARSVQLSGLARTVEDLRRFLDNLIGSPDFTDIFLLQQSREEAGGILFSVKIEGAF